MKQYYTNNILSVGSNVDVTLIFRQHTENGLIDKVSVVMPLDIAFAFQNSLSELLEKIEKKFLEEAK